MCVVFGVFVDMYVHVLCVGVVYVHVCVGVVHVCIVMCTCVCMCMCVWVCMHVLWVCSQLYVHVKHDTSPTPFAPLRALHWE